MYGDRAFQVIPNAFDTKTFVLNSDKRFSIRKKLGVDDNLVIGHIGKFNSQKNQEYLIRAFEKLSYIDDKAMLLLAGNGPDLENIRGQAQRTVCADRIIFGEKLRILKVYILLWISLLCPPGLRDYLLYSSKRRFQDCLALCRTK